MNKVIQHIRKYVICGILAAIPLALVYLVVRFLYISIDQNLMNIIDNYIGYNIPGLGIFILLVFLYLIGQLTSNLFGKWLLNLFERVTRRIPIIGTIYLVGKQISNTLSLPEKQVFKKVVLVNYLKEDIYTVGFITGSLVNRQTSRKLFKVFIPTPPNPTTGTMVIVDADDVIDPGWTIDEGIRTVISGGIIGPNDIIFQKMH